MDEHSDSDNRRAADIRRVLDSLADNADQNHESWLDFFKLKASNAWSSARSGIQSYGRVLEEQFEDGLRDTLGVAAGDQDADDSDNELYTDCI